MCHHYAISLILLLSTVIYSAESEWQTTNDKSETKIAHQTIIKREFIGPEIRCHVYYGTDEILKVWYSTNFRGDKGIYAINILHSDGNPKVTIREYKGKTYILIEHYNGDKWLHFAEDESLGLDITKNFSDLFETNKTEEPGIKDF